MTNWLERAKREIPANGSTANTAKRNLTAVTAVPQRGQSVISPVSNGTIGSTSAAHLREIEARRSRAVLDDGEIIIAPAADASGLVTPATRNEISAGRPDAIAAERIPEAPKRIAAAPIAMDEEVAIRRWLEHIEETDPVIIAQVLDQCRTDADAREYFTRQAKEVPQAIAVEDDRRRCTDCVNLTPGGLCLAAWRGEMLASRSYQPARDVPQRCECYLPKASDTDQRPGRVRWPGYI